jgi:hypothetical protein
MKQTFSDGQCRFDSTGPLSEVGMFEIGALLRAERAAVALLERRDLLLDRLEAEVVCESACAVAAGGLWIGDLGTRGAQLLTARIGSQQVVCDGP